MALGLLGGLALASLATGGTIYANNEAEAQRKRLINQQAEAANETKRKQNSILLEELNQYDPDTRNDAYQDESGQITDSLSNTVKNSLLNSDTTSIAPSADYARANAAAKAASAKRNLKMARLKGNANGVNRLFAREGEGLSRANTDMLLEGNYGQGVNEIFNNKISGVKANPWISGLASAAGSYAGTGG